MREEINLLVKLERQDQALDLLRNEVLDGPERISKFEAKISVLGEDLEADKSRIQEMKKAQRAYEAEVEDGMEHITNSEIRLMAVKSNKEYQALLKEIEAVKRANADQEDKILQHMEERENLSQIRRKKQKELSRAAQELEEQKVAVDADVRRAKEQIREIEKAREGTVKTMGSEVLQTYGRIRATTSGPAVVVAENSTCGGCHMNIPPQMYNELHKGDSLAVCPHCGRIIYWEGLVDTT